MKLRLLFLACIVLVSSYTISLNGQDSLNCFLKDFELKEAVIPPYKNLNRPTSVPTVNVTIDYNDTLSKVSKYIFGNAVAVWVSPDVNNPVIRGHLKKLAPSLIRFPGGSWSDIYFWNGNPGDLPASIPNSSGVMGALNPAFGPNYVPTFDSYLKLRDSIAAQGLITINYAYARYGQGAKPAERAAHLAADWVRKDHGKTKFWEIGNETAGTWEAGWRIDTAANKDGQPLAVTGKLYAEHFKIFADSMRKAAAEVGAHINIGAQIIQYNAIGDPNPNREWNQAIYSIVGDTADFYVIHNYFGGSSTPQSFFDKALSSIRDMNTFIHQDVTSKGGASLPIALTEWNISAEYKVKTSIVTAMQGVLAMSEMAKLGYGMSCRWLVANWDDALNSDGMFYHGSDPKIPAWNPRPDFYYLYFLQKYFGSYMLGSTVTGSSDVLAYTSLYKSGQVGIVLVNMGNTDQTVGINLENKGYGGRYYYYSLTGGSDDPNFSKNVVVNGIGPDTLRWGPLKNIETLDANSDTLSHPVKITSPRLSVQYILLESGSNSIVPVAVDSFYVSTQDDIDSIKVDNGTIQLLGHIVPENATNNEVIWSLSDSAVAKVDAFGLLTALSNGNVTAIGTTVDGAFKDSVKIIITNQRFEVRGLTLASATGLRKITTPGGTLQILTVFDPVNAENQNVTWSVKDTNIATIDSNGLLTAIKNGNALVTCITEESGFKATITININGQNTSIYNSSLAGLKIYPVPATNSLFIENDEPVISYQILNIEGKLLKTINNPGLLTEVDISDLAQGIYLLRAQTGTDFVVKKFIK